MSKLSDNLGAQCRIVAEKAIQSYARDMLMVASLADQIYCEWHLMRRSDDQPSQALLMRIAQRICSRELYVAWRSQDPEMRNCAFDNLRRYLACALHHTGYARSLQGYPEDIEDIVHQTLEALQLAVRREGHAGPDDPAAFLKWAQTILIRQAYLSVATSRQRENVSLDAHTELVPEQYVAAGNEVDPVVHVLAQEVRQTLAEAIVSLRNPRYRLVLIYTYLIGMDECELAERLGAQLHEIYLWRHRALKALRTNPEVMQVLRSLLE